jgi:DNA invertase Pin-like site-specific DNA recombinase
MKKNKYILYCRKSSDSEDKQILSIESQQEELKALSLMLNINIVKTITESKSAKAPGRNGFNKMIKSIEQGEADSILCWKLDRLARNMIDGGVIIDMLQRGKIRHIQANDSEHKPEDNTLLMSVVFGMANQFCIDLSNNVKRGMKKKLINGWKPGLAPPGYINNMKPEQGNRTIVKDPIGFPLIKRALKSILSGLYTPNEALEKLNNSWGYRTPKRKKLGGKPLAKSRFYHILSDPFYCGKFEFPSNSGNWYTGKHKPMISEEEYDTLQNILNNKNRTRLYKNRNTDDFYGVFTCDECGSTITPDRKVQTICTECKTKFSSKHKDECPKCKTKIADMLLPTNLSYTYYKCSKRRNSNCSQKAIEGADLRKQVLKTLSILTISEDLKDWYIECLNKMNKTEKENNHDTVRALQEAYNDCKIRINNLLNIKISPQNTDGSILSDEKYKEENNRLIKERDKIKEKINDVDATSDQWTKDAIKTYNFACYSEHWFKYGTIKEKKAVLSGLCSNLKIRDKKVLISLPNHLSMIKKANDKLATIIAKFEPKNLRLEYIKTDSLKPAFTSLHA